jgi:hypothetical protein
MVRETEREEIAGRRGVVPVARSRDDDRIPIQPVGVLPQSANRVKSGSRRAVRSAEKSERIGDSCSERTVTHPLPPLQRG